MSKDEVRKSNCCNADLKPSAQNEDRAVEEIAYENNRLMEKITSLESALRESEKAKEALIWTSNEEIVRLEAVISKMQRALKGAFHRDSCKDKGLGVCFHCIEAIKDMEEALGRRDQ